MLDDDQVIGERANNNIFNQYCPRVICGNFYDQKTNSYANLKKNVYIFSYKKNNKILAFFKIDQI